MKKVRQRMVAAGYRWEHAWVAEPYADGGVHIHVLQHGDFVPREVLCSVWGNGDVRIETARDPAAIAQYMVKTFRGGERERALERNGGRCLHLSRGFYLGLTKREAAAKLRAERSNGATGTWYLEPL